MSTSLGVGYGVVFVKGVDSYVFQKALWQGTATGLGGRGGRREEAG